MAEFTIITPVLNGAAYIERCILSVAGQGVDVQHIVMDGGSTDGTQDIIAKHAPLIAHWESKEDNGQSDAINKGLALAEGRICNWLNADDVLCDGALREVAQLMDEDTDVVFGKCAHVDSMGKTLTMGGTEVHPKLEQTLGRYSMGQPSHFYRTEAWKQLGPLNTGLHYAMDMELWFRYLLRHGQGRVRSTERVLSHFLLRDDAKSQRMAEEMRAEKMGLFHALLSSCSTSEEIRGFLNGFPVPKDVAFKAEQSIDLDLVMAHLCLALLPQLYGKGEVARTAALLAVVNNSGLLSVRERFLWELRLLKLRLTA